MDALAGQRVEVGGEHGHQRLALARAHLRDAPVMQHDAADELYVERAQAQHAARRLPHHLRAPARVDQSLKRPEHRRGRAGPACELARECAATQVGFAAVNAP